MTNKEKGVISKLRKQARSTSQKCYNPSCNDLSIRSHIHQAEGPIREIASADGKIVQLEDLEPTFNNGKSYHFKEKGIKQKGDVLTFWGFCNKCDNKIFKDIESKEVDLSSYRNQLLFAYKGFLSKHYKQEYNVKWYELIYKSDELSKKIKENFLKHRYINFYASVKFGRYTKRLLENDLQKGVENFKFIYFELPKIEICTSSVFTLPTIAQIDIESLEKEESFPPLNSTNFINLIPKKNNLNVILGCHADKNLKGKLELSRIAKHNQKDKIKLISDIIIKRLETWLVSKNLYNKWKDQKKDKEILNQIHKYLLVRMKEKHIKFNMFQDVY